MVEQASAMAAEGDRPPAGDDRPARPGRARLLRLLIAAPLIIAVLLIASQALTLVRLGVNVPYGDDWYPYQDGDIGSFDPGYLFTPINGSLWVIGKAVGSLAFVLVGGDSIVYQLATMLFVLGALVALQWRLLQLSLRDAVLASLAFVLCLPMLKVGHYWGVADLSYHQSVPLVALLAAAWLLLRPQAPGRLTAVAITALCVIGGLAWVAGALGMLACAVVLAFAAFFARGADRRRLVNGTVAIGIAGALTSAAHLSTIGGTGGAHLSSFPWQADWWAYALGVVSGSLSLPSFRTDPVLGPLNVALAIGMTIAAAVAVLISIGALVRWERGGLAARRVHVVLLLTSAMTSVYVVGVASARAYYSLGPDPSLSDIFFNGASGHHSFWPVIVWPWVGAVLMLAVQGRVQRARARLAGAAIVVVLGVGVVGISTASQSFDYPRWFGGMAVLRQQILDCVRNTLETDRPATCLGDRPWDLTTAAYRATAAGATFTRALQLLPSPADRPALYRLSADPEAGSFEGALDAQRQADGSWAIGGGRVSIPTVVASPEALAACRVVELQASVRPAGRAIVSATSPGTRGDLPLTRYRIVRDRDDDDGSATQSVFLFGPDGFANDVTLILEPRGEVTLEDVALFCRSTKPPA